MPHTLINALLSVSVFSSIIQKFTSVLKPDLEDIEVSMKKIIKSCITVSEIHFLVLPKYACLLPTSPP